ncbi:MAG: hypothetical protein LBN39_00295 [Planctomycetaceae bacterium]|jgi:chromosomal replication initiator protein|nr:hypothetical protein [Planctomycetaceae bacterium]
MNSGIRILPFQGKALEYQPTESPQMFFSGTQRGFLIGPENYLLEPVIQWAINGDAPRNALPLLFYGQYGSGRSHLLRGIFDAWQKNKKPENGQPKAYYISAVDFARYYTEAIHTKTTEDFRKRYRDAALLLIDDLDELKERQNIQDELRFVLDVQSHTGGITVFSASQFPFEPGQFSEPLSARLSGGTAVPVLLPGFAVRKQLLSDLSASFRVPLAESVLDLLAEKWSFSFPNIYGHFARMYFEAQSANVKADTVFVRKFAKEHNAAGQPKIADIVKKTAKHFSLKISDLTGTSRNKTIALARSIAVYLVKQQTELTIKDIGFYFGKRDPATVRSMLKRIHKELPLDPLLRKHLFQLQ